MRMMIPPSAGVPVLLVPPQALVGVMIDAAVADFGVLDYTPTAASAVLDTLALLSSNSDALGTESQVRSFSSQVDSPISQISLGLTGRRPPARSI